MDSTTERPEQDSPHRRKVQGVGTKEWSEEMKELKEILVCTAPFVVAALLLYPLLAIMGANSDPFMWQREDRVFYFICTVTFGWGLLARVQYVSKWSTDGSH